MKGYILFLLILLSIIISTLLYTNNFYNKKSDKMDGMATALSTMKKRIPAHNNYSYRGEPGDVDAYSFARYLLAPQYLSIDPNVQFDTTLVIQYIKPLDSNLTLFVQSQHIIWHEEDTVYSYTLTRKP